VIAYAATLDLPREVALHLAMLLREERHQLGTRRGRRSLGCFKRCLGFQRRDARARASMGIQEGRSAQGKASLVL
jgi:hypothetical protein